MKIYQRAELAPSAWDRFVDAHPQGWWWHRSEWIDYSLAYNTAAIDRSFAIVSLTNEIQAIFPLVQEGDGFSMGGDGCPQPLIGTGMIGTGYGYVRDLAKQLGLESWVRRGTPTPDRVAGFQTFVLDLRRADRTIWSGIRKSYRPLINKTLRDRVILVAGGLAAGQLVDQCRVLHEAVSGRATRPGTWQHWQRWALTGNLCVALVRSGMVWSGFSAAICYKDYAYYAASATRERNTSHALQWRLIQRLKEDGIARYELGWDVRDSDSEKDAGIAQFKGGFGADLWCQPWTVENFA